MEKLKKYVNALMLLGVALFIIGLYIGFVSEQGGLTVDITDAAKGVALPVSGIVLFIVGVFAKTLVREVRNKFDSTERQLNQLKKEIDSLNRFLNKIVE